MCVCIFVCVCVCVWSVWRGAGDEDCCTCVTPPISRWRDVFVCGGGGKGGGYGYGYGCV